MREYQEITDDPDQVDDIPNSPPSATETIQTLSENQGSNSTAKAPKVENRPPHVKGKKGKSGKKAGNQVKPWKMPDNPSLPPLSIKQSLFVKALTDPSSPTYGNQTESYRRVYGQNLNDNTAAVCASQAIRRPKVHTWIEEILEKAGCSTKARVADLALIAAAKSTPRIIRKILTDHKGRTSTIEIQETPTAGERLKAIDQLNKLSGDYAKAQAAGSRIANDEYDSLVKRTTAKVKQRTVKHDDSEVVVDGGTGAKTGEGD